MECETVGAGSALAVVCIHRTSEPASPGLKASIDYSAMNVTSCGGSLRYLSFDKDICPGWGCFDNLHAALVHAGLEKGAFGGEPELIKTGLTQFYLTDRYIVFLGAQRGTYDERFAFGSDVLALPLDDLVKAAPGARDLLRDLGLRAADQ